MSGALSTVLIIALFAGMAFRPLRPRHSTPFSLQFAVSWWINELPVLGLWWLWSGTSTVLLDPGLGSGWWLILALASADAALLGWLLLRALADRPALAAALRAEYGPRGEPVHTPAPWWRILLIPILAWRPDVRRFRNRRYGPARRAHRLDVYAARRPRGDGRPVLVYFHPGGFVMGSKLLGARPLFQRLAARGWICVSADYRLAGATYADRLTDARAALGWVRSHIGEYGGDPEAVHLAGGSAGAHLAANVALAGEPVRGVIAMYGYYGPVDDSLEGGTAPGEHIGPHAPPFLIVHGRLDTLVRREDARAFAERLRAGSRRPVVYAELPGGNHNFDLFPSLRLHAVTDAVIRFTELAAVGSTSTLGPGPG